MSLAPIRLEDEFVALEPIESRHIDGLFSAGQDPSTWQWTTESYCGTLAQSKKWVGCCLERAGMGTQQAFVIIDKVNDKIVGSSSYLNIALEHKSIEIGFTFLSPSAQRTHINRRCKFLLLNHAFESLQVNRVTFQTHEKNQKSRQAIAGIGARFEGIMRDCRIQHDGSIRSSAVYSIIRPEWPQAKANLLDKLELYSNH
jgi:RimJ/RimL family protein N-acetyltransferase